MRYYKGVITAPDGTVAMFLCIPADFGIGYGLSNDGEDYNDTVNTHTSNDNYDNNSAG